MFLPCTWWLPGVHCLRLDLVTLYTKPRLRQVTINTTLQKLVQSGLTWTLAGQQPHRYDADSFTITKADLYWENLSFLLVNKLDTLHLGLPRIRRLQILCTGVPLNLCHNPARSSDRRRNVAGAEIKSTSLIPASSTGEWRKNRLDFIYSIYQWHSLKRIHLGIKQIQTYIGEIVCLSSFI